MTEKLNIVHRHDLSLIPLTEGAGDLDLEGDLQKIYTKNRYYTSFVQISRTQQPISNYPCLLPYASTKKRGISGCHK